jgi:dTDP-4-amino-4,6-dideoxygalactose transaminase
MVPFIDNKELEASNKVLKSRFVTEGAVTRNFEKRFAKYVKAGFAVATTSGATALELSLHILGIGQGDEVIIPSFTHPATGNCILSVGAKPVFADINLETLNIDPQSIKSVISKKTKGVIAVSQFGNPVDIQAILELQKKHGFHLIEDAACSVGSKLGNRMVGTQADLSCFSFHPRKIITTGEGGMIVSNNKRFEKKIRSIKNFGLVKNKNQFIQKTWGTNSKMTDIQASIGLAQLDKVERIIKDRISKAQYYSKLFESIKEITIPFTQKGTRHSYQTYCLLINKKNQRDKLMSYLKKFHIETRIGTYALHLEPAFSKYVIKDLPNSAYAYKNGLAIPLHYELAVEDQEFIVNKIDQFLNL